MTQVRIIDPGASKFRTGQVVDYQKFAEETLKLHKEGKTAPTSEVVHSNKPVRVTFGAKKTTTESESDVLPKTLHRVYIDGEEAGDAYLTPGREFDVIIFLARGAMPYAQKVLTAAERYFSTRNIQIAYYD
jgi:hypothetical protein